MSFNHFSSKTFIGHFLLLVVGVFFFSSCSSSSPSNYQLVFNSNGGASSQVVIPAVKAGTLLYKVNLPSMTKTGYVLSGWATSPTAKDEVDIYTYAVNQNTVLYAVWKIPVKFNIAYPGGDYLMSATFVRYEARTLQDAIAAANFTAKRLAPVNGYSLIGWSLTPGSGVSGRLPYNYKIEKETAFYAIWEIIPPFVGPTPTE